MRTLILVCVLLVALPPVARAELTSQQIKQDFEFFWKSYREAYVFWELKGQDHGVDAEQLYKEYAAQIPQCSTRADLLRMLNEIQARLHDGHAGNEALTSVGPISLQRAAFVLGADNAILVSKVGKDSELEKAGIKAGDEIVKFEDTPVATLARQARSLFGASSEGQFWSIFASLMHVHHPFRGPAPATCKMTFKKADGTQVNVEAPWKVIDPSGSKEKMSFDDFLKLEVSGPLPMEGRIYKDSNVAYLRVESFMKTEDPTKQLDKFFSDIAGTNGLILDVRDNGGGVGPWGVLLASYMIPPGCGQGVPNDSYFDRLYSETFFRLILSKLTPAQIEQVFTSPELMSMIFGKLGVQLTPQEMASHFENGRYKPFYVKTPLGDYKPGVAPYTRPVVALTNGGCFSTTDICLTILDEYKRIRVVGTPNGAGSGSPIPFVLPNSGVKFMVPHARAYPPSGRMIEGRPLTPEKMVAVTQADLAAGVDRALVTAMEMLVGKTKAPVDAGARFSTVANTLGSRLPAELRALIHPASLEAKLAPGASIDQEELKRNLKK